MSDAIRRAARPTRILRLRGWQRFGLPLVLYTLAALFMTYPLILHLSTHAPGPSLSGSDTVEHLRMIWWTKYALQHGLNPFYQSLFGYPDGFFSSVQWAQPLVYWPPALLSFVFNPTASFNLWLLVTLVLDGLAAYWLCLEILAAHEGHPQAMAAAMVGGLVYMAFPTVQGHVLIGHVNIVSVYALPVVVLCLLRIMRGRGTTRIALLGALATWVLLLTNSTSLVFLVLPLLVFGGIYALAARRQIIFTMSGRQIGQLLMMGGAAAVLSAPFYLPLVLDALIPEHASYLQLQGVGWVLFSTDLLSFVALSPFTPWTRPFAPAFSETILNANAIEGAAYLGIAAFVLALIAAIQCRRAVGPWLTILLGSMLFSLGPMLKWQEQPVVYTLGLDKSNIVLPWALFQNLPLLNIIRTPGRFNFLTALALSVLAALGLSIVLRRVRRPTIRTAFCAALVILILAEYQLKFPLPIYDTLAQPAYLQTLATRTDVRAVFDIPYDATYHDAIAEQMDHSKAILTGYYSRLPPVDPAKLMLLSEVAKGTAWQTGAADRFPGPPLAPDQARSVLKDNGIDVLIYHLDKFDARSTLDWAVRAFGQPAYRDQQIAVFEVPPPGQHWAGLALTHQAIYWWPYSTPGSGWWPDDNRPIDALWMKAGVRIVVYTPVATLQRFTLDLAPLLSTRALALAVDGNPAHTWNVKAPTDQVDFWLALRPGFHALQFSPPDGCTRVPVAPTCLLDSNTQVESSPACQLHYGEENTCVSLQFRSLQAADLGVPYQELKVDLDSGLSLRGLWLADEASTGSVLPVATDWHTSQKLPGDYHFFMHVFSRDGKLAAQYDNIPGGGAFSTTRWSASQNWTEITPLAIPADTAPGTYDVYVGWYRYPDMLRLGVHSDRQRAIDGLVYLKSILIR